jgi:hypothetical protein
LFSNRVSSPDIRPTLSQTTLGERRLGMPL